MGIEDNRNPIFPDDVWDGTTQDYPSRALDKRPGPTTHSRHVSEIVALEEFLDGLSDIFDLLQNVGAANSIIGVDDSGTGLEYKTLVAGDNITITHGTEEITINATGGSVETYSATTDSNLDIGSPVYVKSTGNIAAAQANNSAETQVIGLSLEQVTANSTCNFVSEGSVTQSDWTAIIGSASLTPGTKYFLDDSSAGKLTATAPTTGGSYVCPVGRAVTATKLDIEIARPILL